MDSVDNRIVKMQFDNQQFENGIQTSVKSLDTLKKSLNLDESAKSLSNLDKVGKSFSLAGISESVENIANKFTTLGIIGVTALQNITNSALNAAKSLIKSLTVDPILTGLSEYETKMNSIQTILTNTASKGTTLDDVNKALNTLNEYSDKTIYNFAEMARNIGTFTAAGVDLDIATSSIKGIANLAAGSGSSAAQAATAMYQLSQAIAAGSVKLMDWNSVVNAGMGGELFQNALKETAKDMGIVVDAGKPFRETLESGWLTSEVLTKTLSKFADDELLVKAATQVKTFTQLLDTMKESVQSGWAQSWEQIIGNKDQAASFFTSINDGFGAIVGTSADARNAMLAFWNANGGRDALIEALSNAFKGLQSILKPIGEAFKEVFPAMTGQRLIEITNGIKDLTANFKIGEETATNLKNTFKGFFALLDIGKMALTALANGLGSLVKMFLPVGDGVLYFTGGIGNFIVAIDQAIKSSDAFNVVIKNIAGVIKPVADGIIALVKIIVNAFKSIGDPDLTGLDTFSEKVQERFQPLTKLGEFLTNLFSIFYNLASTIGSLFAKMSENILNSLNAAEFNSIFDLINGTLFAGILYGIKKFINSLTEITDNVGGLLSDITGIFDGVRGCLVAYQSSLKAGILLKIAISLGILAAALLTISMIDSDKLTSSLAAMTAMFMELFGAMAMLESIMGSTGFLAMFRITSGMIALSVAILILSEAMSKLGQLKWDEVAKGLTSIAVLSLILVAASKALSSTSGMLIRSSLGFILFAAAINILTNAVRKLGTLNLGDLTKGLIGVGVLVTELALFMNTTQLNSMGIIKSVGILILAESLVILSSAVKKLSEINLGDLIKGLMGVGVMLTEIVVFTNVIGDCKNLIITAVALTILGEAILLLSKSIVMIGSMPLADISKGLLGMGGALFAITLAFNTLPKNIFIQSLALLDVAGAILMMAQALNALGAMSWDQIARALTAMTFSLGIIIGAFMLLQKSSLADSMAFTVLVLGITMLAGALNTLGSMSLVQIGTALLALAGTFVVIGAAATFLSPLTPAILALSAALVVFGIAVLAIGAGVLALSSGLAALAVAGTAGAVALVAVVTSLIGLIPFAMKTLAQGVVEFAKIIGDGAPVLAQAFKQVALAIIDVIITITPNIVKAIVELLKTLLTTLLDYMPVLIDTGMKLILAFLKGIADNIKEVVTTAIDVVVNFIEGVASKVPDVINAAFDLMLSFINGLADAIRKNTDRMIDAVSNLMRALVDAGLEVLSRAIGGFVDAGRNIIDGFIDGIKSKISEAAEWAANLAKTALDAAKEALDINSPSKAFSSLGMYAVQGLANGLKKFAKVVVSPAKNVANITIDSVKDAFSRIGEIVNDDLDLSPTIRPVLDLTNVESGKKGLNNIFDRNGLNITGINGRVSLITNGLNFDNSSFNELINAISELKNKNQNDSNVSFEGIYKGAIINVRTEDDIRKIARELFDLQQSVSRGRGIATI